MACQNGFKLSSRLFAGIKFVAGLWLIVGLAACTDKPQEAAMSEAPKINEPKVNEPRGYVEFAMPESAPGEASIGVDTQIYQIENGQRVFKGMTRKWKGLAEQKRGLTVVARPGEHDFVVVHEGAQATVKVAVKQNGYHRVRISMTGLSQQEMIGTTRQLRFGLQAVVEPSQ